mmetsp:Transcript_24339/g.60354  ORF Transcript_24339/g.60354 Transcript_24339/m.60354 type:complete len:155 (+) Transcript_24339:20-484(+)
MVVDLQYRPAQEGRKKLKKGRSTVKQNEQASALSEATRRAERFTKCSIVGGPRQLAPCLSVLQDAALRAEAALDPFHRGGWRSKEYKYELEGNPRVADEVERARTSDSDTMMATEVQEMTVGYSESHEASQVEGALQQRSSQLTQVALQLQALA